MDQAGGVFNEGGGWWLDALVGRVCEMRLVIGVLYECGLISSFSLFCWWIENDRWQLSLG